MSCSDCLLHGNVEVPYKKGKDTSIMFIGESPESDDVISGVPFSSSSGQFFREALNDVGLNMDDFFIANSSRCMLDKQFKKVDSKVRKVLTCCRENLETVINVVKPKVIVLLGRVALKQITKKAKLVDKHGVFQFSSEFSCYIFSTYQPSFCMLYQQYRPILVEDLKKLARFKKTGYILDQDTIDVSSLESMQTLLDLDPDMVAIDTETQGLNPFNSASIILSFSVAFAKDNKSLGSAHQIFLYEKTEESQESEFSLKISIAKAKTISYLNVGVSRSTNFESKVSELYNLLINPNIKKVMFNGNYDLLFLKFFLQHNGYPDFVEPANYYMDVQAAAHLLEENVYLRASLEHTRKGFTNFYSNYSTDFDLKVDKSLMVFADKEDMIKYASLDAYTTLVSALSIDSILKSEEAMVINPFIPTSTRRV